MKQSQVDKHTVAWFKIAECVSRGEKERALGVYRLLSHSFNDNAIARQLEGDIYSSFGENDHACVLYEQSMELYHKSDRFLEAASVGEHLVEMRPTDIALHRTMIQLYMSLSMLSKIRAHVQVLVDIFAQKHQWYDIKNMVVEYSNVSDGNARVSIYGDIITIAHKAGCPWDVLVYSINQAFDDLCLVDNDKCVQGLLTILQMHSDQLYDHAVVYLTK